MAQHQVKGTVTDSVGQPLIGVNIVEKGTYHGTTTNTRGEFRLQARSSSATLIFSYLGYHKKEVTLEGESELEIVLEENPIQLGVIQVVGTRSFTRTATETPVPIDVIDVKEIADHSGQVEVNQLLQYLAPSFNSNKQSGADGADHIDPATLRGLGPDQTLVLINGKRRHQSSLINIFGSRGRGNTGTDLNAIPAGAIDRIEILRDGASAQYGSDAIAGVINIVLKSSVEEFTGSVMTGAYNAKPPSKYDVLKPNDYDGETTALTGNYGVRIGTEGYANFTLDYMTRNKTNRPADPAAFDIYRQKFGDAGSDNFALFVNSAVPLGPHSSFYAYGGFNQRYTDAYAWTRTPDSERNVLAIYPNGFNPRITSDISDKSVSTGLRSQWNGWEVDFNNTIGSNRFHYIIDGTLNATLLEKSPTRFDAGGFSLAQNTTGLSLSRFFPDILKGANIAFGSEYRIDNYEIFSGEEGSYRTYDQIIFSIDSSFDDLGNFTGMDTTLRPGGSQGFPGFQPADEVDAIRTNLGAFVDAEFDITKEFMVGGAVRFEHYSDFGNTLNGKLAMRYKVMPDFIVRGSASTGFRAPSLAQIYFNSTFTDFVSGQPVDKIIARNNSPISRALGIPTLKEETATDISGGFTARYGSFTASVDGYFVEIKDRIVLTGAFEDTDPDIGADLQTLGVGAAQFFTNAIDTKTKGIDIVLGWSELLGQGRINTTLAGNFNDMTLGDVHTNQKLAGKEDIYFGRREKLFLLASAPDSKITLTVDYKLQRFNADLQFIRFGEVTLEDWLGTDDVYKAKIVTNLTLGYDLTQNLSLTAGAVNLLNVYPTQQDTETETGGLWDAVQMGSSGAFYFTKLAFKF
jgi:iron complex outermembrane receptor protein